MTIGKIYQQSANGKRQHIYRLSINRPSINRLSIGNRQSAKYISNQQSAISNRQSANKSANQSEIGKISNQSRSAICNRKWKYINRQQIELCVWFPPSSTFPRPRNLHQSAIGNESAIIVIVIGCVVQIGMQIGTHACCLIGK